MAVADNPNRDRLLLPNRALETHLHVIGQPGTGKSYALESWAMQRAAAGQGVGVFDVHGDLFNHLVSRVALMALDRPEVAERVVIIDPLDPIWVVGFNPLEALLGFSRERLAAFLTDVMIRIWKIETTEAPRMVRLMTMTFIALGDLGLKLGQLPRFLSDADWRDTQLSRTSNPEAAAYFRFEFPKTEGGAQQWAAPVINKVGALFLDPALRLMFSSRSTINFPQILDGRKILLVKLYKGHLGEENSALLGAFILAHLQKAALARADENHRPMFYLYLDEFQNYATSNVADLLSETRKYHLNLTLAHQYLDQMTSTPQLLGAILNTPGTLACFRVGYQDASLLAREIFAPGSLELVRWGIGLARLGRYPILVPQRMTASLGHEEFATLLTHQDKREFWLKQRGPFGPQKLRTLDLPMPRMSDKLARAREELIRISGQRYGRLKAEVRREMEQAPSIIPYVVDGQYRVINDYEDKR